MDHLVQRASERLDLAPWLRERRKVATSGDFLDQSPTGKAFLTQPPTKGFQRKSKSHTPQQYSKRAVARSAYERQCAIRAGSQRALHADRTFQLELQAKWQREFEKEVSIGLAWKCKQSLLFNLPHDSRSLGRAALPRWLEDVHLLESDLEHALPQITQSRIEFTVDQTQRLQHILEMMATTSDPEYGIRIPPDHLSRPTFCRFILDSGLVNCDFEPPRDTVPYHEAVRLFDASALSTVTVEGVHTHSLLSCVPTLTFSHVAEIVIQCFERLNEPGYAISQFFEFGLVRLQRIGEAVLDIRALKMKHRMIELSDDSHNASLVSSKHRKECLSIHGAPPRVFGGSVQEWASGLHFWMRTGDDSATPKAIEKQHNQEGALDSYIVDMIIEPGVLYVAQVCSTIFEKIFDVYADELRKKWDSDGTTKIVKHLSYAAFFRFCVDFGVFPSLCSFGFAKKAYSNTECMEDLGERPAPEEPEPISPSIFSSSSNGESRSSRAKDNSRRPSNQPNMRGRRNSFSDPATQLGTPQPQLLKSKSMTMLLKKRTSPSDSDRSSQPGQAPSLTRSQTSLSSSKAADLTRSVSQGKAGAGARRNSWQDITRDRVLNKIPERPVVVAIDLEWIKMSFASMSEPRLKLYSLLCAIGDCAADNFNTVVGLFTSVMVENEDEDDDFGESRSIYDIAAIVELATAKSCDRTIGAAEISETLAKIHVTHPWTVADIEEFVLTLVPDAQGRVRLLDLEKATGRVREDIQSRSPSESAAFRGLGFSQDSLWSGTGRSPGKNGVLSPLGNLALGDQARTLENEPGWLGNGDSTQKLAFGAACFMECLFRIAFNYLHSTAVPAHAAMPGGPRAVWLVSFLYHKFDHLLGSHQATVSGSRPSTRSTEASTRPWTPDSDMESPMLLPKAATIRPLSGTKTSCATLPLPSVKWGSRPKSGGNARRDPFISATADAAKIAGESAKLPKQDVAYVSKRIRILEGYPNLFEGLPWLSCNQKRPQSGTRKRPQSGSGRRQLDVDGGADSLLDTVSSICETCSRSRGPDGVGSIHCHSCSGIRNTCLRNSPLWPVINRQRLRRERTELLKEAEAGARSQSHIVDDTSHIAEGDVEKVDAHGTRKSSIANSIQSDVPSTVQSDSASARQSGKRGKKPRG